MHKAIIAEGMMGIGMLRRYAAFCLLTIGKILGVFPDPVGNMMISVRRILKMQFISRFDRNPAEQIDRCQ